MHKTIFTTLTLFLLTLGKTFAHYMWIETEPVGKIGQEQEIRIYFGEYTYGVIEKVGGDAFTSVKDFSVWVADAKGNRTELQASPAKDHYLAIFTPTTNGTYTVIMDNNNIDVIDYSEYDFGIFKTHYHSVARIQVGEETTNTIAANDNGITVKVVEGSDKAKLQVLYKNKALPKHEVVVYVADRWSKTMETDEQGHVAFDLPWDTQYLVEVTQKEEVPGTYNGKSYEFVWHCVSTYLRK